MAHFKYGYLVLQKKDVNRIHTEFLSRASEVTSSVADSTLDVSLSSCLKIQSATSTRTAESRQSGGFWLRQRTAYNGNLFFWCKIMSHRPCACRRSTREKFKLGCFPMRCPCQEVFLSFNPKLLLT